jgi:hypothetical protein
MGAVRAASVVVGLTARETGDIAAEGNRVIRAEPAMQLNMPGTGKDDGLTDDSMLQADRSTDAEWTLTAIASAIAVGHLPPDDAFAWARIAVYEAEFLDG